MQKIVMLFLLKGLTFQLFSHETDLLLKQIHETVLFIK